MPCFSLQDAVHDRAADGIFSCRFTPSRKRTAFGSNSVAVRVPEHDAAVVGLDGAEDQVHDLSSSWSRSRMWLTAWVVSYMTPGWRQALLEPLGPEPGRGWARIRLPSFSPMVLTMATVSSIVLLGLIRRIWSARSLGRPVRPPGRAVKTRIVWPIWMWSPGFEQRPRWTVWVLTWVPLALPTSRMRYVPLPPGEISA